MVIFPESVIGHGLTITNMNICGIVHYFVNCFYTYYIVIRHSYREVLLGLDIFLRVACSSMRSRGHHQ